MSNEKKSGRGLHIALWVVQGLLAFAFGGSGTLKLLTPYDQLAATMAWAAVTPAWLIVVIGAAEVLGALGLILPAVTRIQPQLTPLAAAGLMTIMVLAAGVHLMIGEVFIVPNVVLGGLAGFVLWGRLSKAPIVAR